MGCFRAALGVEVGPVVVGMPVAASCWVENQDVLIDDDFVGRERDDGSLVAVHTMPNLVGHSKDDTLNTSKLDDLEDL